MNRTTMTVIMLCLVAFVVMMGVLYNNLTKPIQYPEGQHLQEMV